MQANTKTNFVIPKHLQPYVVEQNYDKYTEVDQQVWRHVLHRNYNFLKDVAHPAYVDGLRKTGISLDHIPRVEEMNQCLQPSGWGAVTIDGFIPAVVFFDFQSRGILPIATDIRKPEHIDYTPAPDIIHEAAGHAPILSDKWYADYVKRFGKIGSKAFATREEHEVFEAIRSYSKLMEDPKATQEEVQLAKEILDAKQSAVTGVSEAEEIARLYWWTVEYGLFGKIEKPLLYGAGLLSSIEESRHCLTDAVIKRPFSLEETISTAFDITKMQPQLFVCESFDQLLDSVERFKYRMAFHTGGKVAMEKALRSGATSTVVYSSGLQVTGTLESMVYTENSEIVFFRTEGPTALAWNNQELNGHGKSTHTDGFSSPIGRLQGVSLPLELFTDGDLEAHGIRMKEHVNLMLEGGITVEGRLEEIVRQEGKILLLSFNQCKISHHGRTLFQSDQGTYDMAVGERIVSTFAGAADPERFFE
ncbi:aromatic amino acid hydroxylase [Brevibacillus sp. VP]|uniref:aromatic amino acid hydroxylase n=1 Tax=unclassified Brevibacillus TaxID=2684853 RepID=UPI000E2F692F|nr:aromatic amino acid hydroxylase [Brevibacillus sp. VP]RFB33992.1 aromatic amino acid hydroxylase [Brevibacillus sp. VP]